MLKKIFQWIVLFAVAGTGVARASCADCVAKNNLIIFPRDPAQKEGDLYLAWNFKGVANVDYERMLSDEHYAQVTFDTGDNMTKVTNYIVNKNGGVLATIPDMNPASPYGGIFGAAGLSPNHRGSIFWEDQGLVYFQMDTRWYTGLVKIFRKMKMGRGQVLNVSEIQNTGVKELLPIYMGQLDQRYGSQANYKRDRQSLAIRFDTVIVTTSGCKDKGFEYCLKMKASAEVPKAPLEDNFGNQSTLCLGIKRSFWGNYSLQLISFESGN